MRAPVFAGNHDSPSRASEIRVRNVDGHRFWLSQRGGILEAFIGRKNTAVKRIHVTFK
jgi:hypothetical protein